jgi:hypothetical protein
MKKPLIVFAFVFAIGVSAAFVLGARVGGSELLYADAQYKAAILAWQLHNLRSDRSAAVMARMEASLDSELARHGKYMESRLAWLWPDLKPDDDAAIRDGVSYRLAHPHEAEDDVKQLREKVLVHYKQ